MKELEKRVIELEQKIGDIEKNQPEDKLSMVVFSGDLDKMLAAFIIATGASVMYDRVVLFFTFWGTAALRDINKTLKKEEMIDYPNVILGGVAKYLQEAATSKVSLFI